MLSRMENAGTRSRRRVWPFGFAAVLYLVAAVYPWHESDQVRRAIGIVLATLTLWIAEVAPLGIVAMGIPMASVFTSVLSWREALSAWADPVVFLFLGAFLLARALEKHGVFDWITQVRWSGKKGDHPIGLCLVILLVAGAISTMQNNTAVCAMMLPVTVTLARRTRGPAWVLLALAWGSTFGGMATPVGTAPNFIGYAAIKKIDPAFTFISWLRVGVPVWLGTTFIGWAVLAVAARIARGAPGPLHSSPAWVDSFVRTDVGPEQRPAASVNATNSTARRWVLLFFSVAVVLWIVPGVIISSLDPNHPKVIFLQTYLPESLVPLAVAWVMFLFRVGPHREPILDRHDFQALDWDTLFLIAGGMCLGRILESSGSAQALAHALVGTTLSPRLLMACLAFVTVLLSELTSNTATASLLVPIAGSLATAISMPRVKAIWLVSLAASLGFALPVSTPPNALVYGTRLIPLRVMIATGLIVDVLATIWLLVCMTMFTD